MMKRNYKIFRKLPLCVTTVGLISALFNVDKFENIPNYQKTEEDNLYEKTLEEINNETEVIFENQELLEYLKEKKQIENITREELKSLTYLTITNKLSDQNFSDLKYFPNLTTLTIKNNDIDLEDIYYNSKLTTLTITKGNVVNTVCIPNSVEKISFTKVTCTDGHLIIPYFTTNVSICNCLYDDLYFENPQILEELEFVENHSFDLKLIANSALLEKLTIEKCYDVKNSGVLKNLSSVTKIKLDESALCWTDLDTLMNINYTSENDLKFEFNVLNEIIKEIIPNKNINTEAKMNNILSFIKNNVKIYEYDYKNIDFSSYTSKEGNETNVKIYCTKTTSNYLAAALAKTAEIDAIVEKDKEEKTYVNVDGNRIDVGAYVTTGGKKYLNVPYNEVLETKNTEEGNYNLGPLAPYYTKQIKLNLKKMEELDKTRVSLFACATMLLTVGSIIKKSKNKRLLRTFENAIMDLQYDYEIMPLQAMQNNRTIFTSLIEEIKQKLALVLPSTKTNYSRAEIDAEFKLIKETTMARMREQSAFSNSQNQKLAHITKQLIVEKAEIPMPKQIDTDTEPFTPPLYPSLSQKYHESGHEMNLKVKAAQDTINRKVERINQSLSTVVEQKAKDTMLKKLFILPNNLRKMEQMAKEAKASVASIALPAIILPNEIEAIKEQARIKAMEKVVVEEPLIIDMVEEPTDLSILEVRQKNYEIMDKMAKKASASRASIALPAVIFPNKIEAIKEQARIKAMDEVVIEEPLIIDMVEKPTDLSILEVGQKNYEIMDKMAKEASASVASKALPAAILPNEIEAIKEQARKETIEKVKGTKQEQEKLNRQKKEETPAKENTIDTIFNWNTMQIGAYASILAVRKNNIQIIDNMVKEAGAIVFSKALLSVLPNEMGAINEQVGVVSSEEVPDTKLGQKTKRTSKSKKKEGVSSKVAACKTTKKRSTKKETAKQTTKKTLKPSKKKVIAKTPVTMQLETYAPLLAIRENNKKIMDNMVKEACATVFSKTLSSVLLNERGAINDKAGVASKKKVVAKTKKTTKPKTTNTTFKKNTMQPGEYASLLAIRKNNERIMDNMVEETKAIYTPNALPAVILPNEIEAIKEKARIASRDTKKEQILDDGAKTPVTTNPKTIDTILNRNTKQPGEYASLLVITKNNKKIMDNMVEETKAIYTSKALPAVILPNEIEIIKEKARIASRNTKQPEVYASLLAITKNNKKIMDNIVEETKAIYTPKALPAVILPNQVEALKEQARINVEEQLIEKEKLLSAINLQYESALAKIKETGRLAEEQNRTLDNLKQSMKNSVKQLEENQRTTENITPVTPEIENSSVTSPSFIFSPIQPEPNWTIELDNVIDWAYQDCVIKLYSKKIDDLNKKIDDIYVRMYNSAKEERLKNVKLFDFRVMLRISARKSKLIAEEFISNNQEIEIKPSNNPQIETFPLVQMCEEIEKALEIRKKDAELETKTQIAMMNNERILHIRDLHILDINLQNEAQNIKEQSTKKLLELETIIEEANIDEIQNTKNNTSPEILMGIAKFYLYMGALITQGNLAYMKSDSLEQKKEKIEVLEAKDVKKNIINVINSEKNNNLIASLETKTITKTDLEDTVQKDSLLLDIEEPEQPVLKEVEQLVLEEPEQLVLEEVEEPAQEEPAQPVLEEVVEPSQEEPEQLLEEDERILQNLARIRKETEAIHLSFRQHKEKSDINEKQVDAMESIESHKPQEELKPEEKPKEAIEEQTENETQERLKRIAEIRKEVLFIKESFNKQQMLAEETFSEDKEKQLLFQRKQMKG